MFRFRDLLILVQANKLISLSVTDLLSCLLKDLPDGFFPNRAFYWAIIIERQRWALLFAALAFKLRAYKLSRIKRKIAQSWGLIALCLLRLNTA